MHAEIPSEVEQLRKLATLVEGWISMMDMTIPEWRELDAFRGLPALAEQQIRLARVAAAIEAVSHG